MPAAQVYAYPQAKGLIGAAGAAGSSLATGGAFGDGGPTEHSQISGNDSGCGCRQSGAPTRRAPPIFGAALLGFTLVRRRR